MKIKQFQITLSVNYPSYHPKKGLPTNFLQLYIEGLKLHTIRANYAYWKKIIDQINEGKGILNIKQWSGIPYHSKPITVATITGGLGYQLISVKCRKVGVFMQVEKLPLVGCLETTIINNDGLTEEDFKSWFKKDLIDGIIIHFTNLRYT